MKKDMPNHTNNRYDADALLSHMPGGILKWGNTMFFLITVALLCFAWIFRYPQTIQTAFSTLRSAEPIVVNAPESGLLSAPLRSDSTEVQKGDTLAVVEHSDAAGRVLKAVVKSPQEGRAEQYLVVQAGDMVQKNQPLFVIYGEKCAPVSAEVQLPVAVIGQVKAGQRAMLHFEAYPSDVYGIVPAVVQDIGKAAVNGLFTLRLTLPDGLKTSQQYSLDPAFSTGGRAEIIVDNPRLIEKLMQPLQMILNKHKQQQHQEKEYPKFTQKGD